MTPNELETLDKLAQADYPAMCQIVLDMARQVKDGFRQLDRSSLESVGDLVREVHEYEKRLVERVRPPKGTPDWGPKPGQEGLFIPMHLERVADNLEALARTVQGRMLREGVLFTAKARHEILALLDRSIGMIECIRDALKTRNRTLVRHVLEESESYAKEASEFARFHEQRLIEGVCLPQASSVYLAMLDHLKGVEWHTRQIASRLSEWTAYARR
ncbi:MAG: hypothetical protein ACE148_00155 [Vicinamibacterales bacterium]